MNAGPPRLKVMNRLASAGRVAPVAGSAGSGAVGTAGMRAAGILIAVATLTGCASVPIRDAVPEKLVAAAELPGLSTVRIWGDGNATDVERFLETEGDAIRTKWQERAKSSGSLVTNILAL